MNASDEHDDRVDHGVIARAAFETLVFAPIGLGVKLVVDAPAAVRRVRQELNNARFIGRLTVEQSAARLRARSDAGNPPDGSERGGETGVVDVAMGSLPIEAYDEMPAIEIIAMLESLTDAERAVIAGHEKAHRRRRTVLGKIAQLAE